MSRILAVDAGFNSTGCAVLELDSKPPSLVRARALVFLKTDKKRQLRTSDTLAEHAGWLFDQLVAETAGCRAVIVEMPSGGAKSAIAMRAMGITIGVLAAVREATKLPTVWVSPGDSKAAACGKLAASKREMQAAMLREYPSLDAFLPRRGGKIVQGKAEHIVDAVAAYHAARGADVLRMLASNH